MCQTLKTLTSQRGCSDLRMSSNLQQGLSTSPDVHLAELWNTPRTEILGKCVVCS